MSTLQSAIRRLAGRNLAEPLFQAWVLQARELVRPTRERTFRGAYPRWLVLWLLAGLGAVNAQTQKIVVTLLPSFTSTSGQTVQTGRDLTVTDPNATDPNGKKFPRSASWLFFSADALPPASEIEITDAQLDLVRRPELSLSRAMLMRVASVDASSGGMAPKSPDYAAAGADVVNFPSNPRDSVSWKPKPGFLHEEKTFPQRYIGLLLMPSGTSASRRVFYGLRIDDKGNARDSEARLQPRLIITYLYKPKPHFGCTSDPSALSALQSDGRSADTSGCDFITKANNPPQDKYALHTVAPDSLTLTPVIYGDLLFVVRKHDGAVWLEARRALGDLAWSLRVDAEGQVLQNSLMVVDRLGRLRIVTGNAIYTCQLKIDQTAPGGISKQTATFGEVPASVVPGPDGTLYIASKGIFALNPDVGPIDITGNRHKLWWTPISNSASARITVSPDGRFVYALAKISDKSNFLAINAQTGKDVDLINEVKDARFPANLDTLYNPVVARHKDGADFVFIAGNSGTGGVLWAVRNVPAPPAGVTNDPARLPDADSTAKLTKVWIEEEKCEKPPCIGQPILDSIPNIPTDLSMKKLYFVLSGSGKAKLVAVACLTCLNGNKRNEFDAAGTNIAANGNPVVDAAGNVMFWANDTFYRFTGGPNPLFALKLPELGNPRLLFGPAGTLYAAHGQTVTALIPSYDVAGIRSIYSPSNLQVTGAAMAGGPLTLDARGSVILGNGFALRNGSTLTVRVNVNQ